MSHIIADYHCPRWKELPTLPLYMDQVLIVVDQAVRPLLSDDAAAATSTMVNNYVKVKAIPPSTKKKYTREHLARLIMITFLKSVLSISEITLLLDEGDLAKSYDTFAVALEYRLQVAFGITPLSDSDPASDNDLLSAALDVFIARVRFAEVLAAHTLLTEPLL